MLGGWPGVIFRNQDPCDPSGAACTRLASDRLSHAGAAGTVSGPAEKRGSPGGQIALDTLAGEAAL
jgi:hypothetical protein